MEQFRTKLVNTVRPLTAIAFFARVGELTHGAAALASPRGRPSSGALQDRCAAQGMLLRMNRAAPAMDRAAERRSVKPCQR